MTAKTVTDEKSAGWVSSALKVNLERTAVAVAIPGQYAPLLKVVESHYGLQKKTQDMLTELNHPFVNWEYVIKELKAISIGDFYIYNHHQDGLAALTVILKIYLDVIKLSLGEDIKDSAIHYLFDYIDTLLAQSNELLSRNLVLIPEIIGSLLAMSEGEAAGKFSKAQKDTNRRFASIVTFRPGCGGGVVSVFYNKSDLNPGRYVVVGDQPISLTVSTIMEISVSNGVIFSYNDYQQL